MFTDPFYNSLDDVSKLIEPYFYSVNDALGKLPHSILISAQDLINTIQSVGHVGNTSGYVVNYSDVMRYKIASEYKDVLKYLNAPTKYEQKMKMGHLLKIYKSSMEVKADGTPMYIDIPNGKLTGKVEFIRYKQYYTDQDLSRLIQLLIGTLLPGLIRQKTNEPIILSIALELADIFSINMPISRSRAKIERSLAHGFTMVVNDKKLNIRSVDLALKLITWIDRLLRNNDYGARLNIHKLKVLSNRKQAIYSIKDEA